MVRSTSPRTALLLRAYCGLLAVSLALSGVLIDRRVTMSRNAAGDVTAPALRISGTPRNPAPTVNWGGQKR
jgi:hypothetical protein